jgi:hypothetical protein
VGVAVGAVVGGVGVAAGAGVSPIYEEALGSASVGVEVGAVVDAVGASVGALHQLLHERSTVRCVTWLICWQPQPAPLLSGFLNLVVVAPSFV